MARSRRHIDPRVKETKKKKTRQGHGKFSKHSSKGGGVGSSTTSKCYRKKRRGQGK